MKACFYLFCHMSEISVHYTSGNYASWDIFSSHCLCCLYSRCLCAALCDSTFRLVGHIGDTNPFLHVRCFPLFA